MAADAHEVRPTWKSVEALRDELLQRSRKASGADSVRRVADACKTLAEGGNVVTIAAIGKFCLTNWGGPKGQSISNNRDLASLVRMASVVQGDRFGSGKPGRSGSYDERLLSRVQDSEARSEVEILLVERRGLINEVNCLKAAFKRVKAIGELTTEMAEADVETLEALVELVRNRSAAPPETHFTDDERAAVRTFLDPARLGRMEGWILDEASGEIRGRSGRPIANPGFLCALRKVASPESRNTAFLKKAPGQ